MVICMAPHPRASLSSELPWTERLPRCTTLTPRKALPSALSWRLVTAAFTARRSAEQMVTAHCLQSPCQGTSLYCTVSTEMTARIPSGHWWKTPPDTSMESRMSAAREVRAWCLSGIFILRRSPSFTTLSATTESLMHRWFEPDDGNLYGTTFAGVLLEGHNIRSYSRRSFRTRARLRRQ